MSVVIPTRDRGRLLVEAVASALAVQPAPLEIIVVDAGSADGSVEEAAALGEVAVLAGDWPNAAASRNAGAREARGDYLAFLDSDDIMLPGKISCLGQLLDEDRGVGLAHGRMDVIDEEGRPHAEATRTHRELLDRAARRGTVYPALAEQCTMFTSATLVRREAFESVGGYDESLEVYEDLDFYLRLSLGWRLVYESCLVCLYRVWQGNVPWGLTAEWTVKVAEKHLAAMPELPSREARRARYGLLRRIASSRQILLQRGAARRAALGALRRRPLRGIADPQLMRVLAGSLLPDSALRRRRPAA